MAMACISATDLTVAFDPKPPVFQPLDVHLSAEPVALIGPNGAGKTVLAEVLSQNRGTLIVVTHSEAMLLDRVQTLG